MIRFRADLRITIAAAVLAAGCAMNKAGQGAIIGAGTGGVVGAVIGNATGSTVRGAIIGAAVGGVAGAVIGHQMDKQAQELAYSLPGATVQRVGEGITVTFPDGLLFGNNSDQLSYTAQDNLHQFAESMVKYPNTRTVIVGHTDSNGSTSYNLDLSVRRAESAAGYVASQGVDRSRISTAGRGETEPIATNDDAAGRQLNRRVEVAIVAIKAAGN